ncbi:Crp/Fnr family transcriptional regulator [Edaphovirga cremea]|uniref:Crp/Fnr family transcriptional regulator n=1 Tax=Edaphovirga cremea TaxID=2267246 RepID=UPI003988A761
MRHIFHQKPWIYPKDPAELRALYQQHGTLVHYRKGTIIKNRGESQKLFYLVNGLCMYYANYVENNPLSFSLVLPERTMGDITCITKQQVNVTTIVIRDADILLVPPDILLKAMQQDAELAIKICRHVVAKQESSLEAVITNMTCEPAIRLKILLKSILLESYVGIKEGWYTVPLTLTHEEYGQIINVTRVTISRILAHWQSAGLICRENKTIIVNHLLFDDVYDWLSYFPAK